MICNVEKFMLKEAHVSVPAFHLIKSWQRPCFPGTHRDHGGLGLMYPGDSERSGGEWRFISRQQ